MNASPKNNYKGILSTDRKTIFLIAKSMLIGTLAGLAVVAYRFVLAHAEKASAFMYSAASGRLPLLILLFTSLLAAGYGIGLLTKKYPLIGGSGIPQVKGILLGYFENSWLSTLIAKFAGGAVCIVAGLSLGREGPSIQLGACVADGVAQRVAATRQERKILISSGASAGLAAAFNAPLAGVMFTLEELFKYFSPSILLSTMTAAITADFISKYIFGLDPVFQFPVESAMPLSNYWLLLLLGILLGVCGAAYNTLLLWSQRAYKRLSFLPAEARPSLAFFCAGILGLTFPVVLGGGHRVIEVLSPAAPIGFLVTILTIKFIFSMISFGCGAPGGIFFPLLIMGASIGAISGQLAITCFGLDQALFYNFIILAMAGFFTAIVRAPITGIVLITEMTGSFQHMLSLSVVSLAAYVVADLLKSRPIYDSLLKNQLHSRKLEIQGGDSHEKISIEVIVHLTSSISHCLVRDIPWPEGCLLVAVCRQGVDLIPNGSTKILPGDYLICLTPTNLETKTRSALTRLSGSSH